MNQSQQILQPKAEEVLRSYEWGRFREVVERIFEIGHNILVYSEEVEENYRTFIDYLVSREGGCAGRVGGGSLNPFEDFVRWHEHGIDFIGSSRNEREEQFIYEQMGDESLDALVRLTNMPDEGDILLPKYWPEEFGDMDELKRQFVERCQARDREEYKAQGYPDDWIEEHVRKLPTPNHDEPIDLFYPRAMQLIDEMGRERYVEVLQEKIPHFPEEVHDSRLQQLKDGQKVLDALYEAVLKCEERFRR